MNAAVYTPQNPPQNPYNLSSLNALGSQFAGTYGYPQTDLIIKDLRPYIFDAAPQQYYSDLIILNQMQAKMTKATEFSWLEKPYGRDAILVTAANAGGGAQITLSVTPSSCNVVAVDTLVGFPNGQLGNVSNINPSLNQITIRMQANTLAPSVAIGATITNNSSLEADSATTVMQGGFRVGLIERYNFIQIMSKGMQWGDYELETFKRSGVTDYLSVNMKELVEQFRVDISNTFWNGILGMCTLSNGATAKTADGVWSIMQKAASPIITSTLANVGAAIEAGMLASEYGKRGQVKFLYMTPTIARAVAKYYKDSLVRYTVSASDTTSSMTAPLVLDAINIGSSYGAIVPYQRFQDTASFPVSFQKMIIGLDHANIEPAYFFNQYMVNTPNRKTGINSNTFSSTLISGDFSIYFKNPLSSFAVLLS